MSGQVTPMTTGPWVQCLRATFTKAANSPCDPALVLHRWCVTGTPVGTDIADLKGQFNFLQLHPFTNKNFFNTYVKPAYSGSSWARSPAYVLLYVLGQCMIRHTKLQVRPPITTLQPHCCIDGDTDSDCPSAHCPYWQAFVSVVCSLELAPWSWRRRACHMILIMTFHHLWCNCHK